MTRPTHEAALRELSEAIAGALLNEPDRNNLDNWQAYAKVVDVVTAILRKHSLGVSSVPAAHGQSEGLKSALETVISHVRKVYGPDAEALSLLVIELADAARNAKPDAAQDTEGNP